MSVSIKTVFDGNIHRFNLTKPSYDELEKALNSIYGKRGFSIRYQDEDGDMINVSSSLELQEALRVADGKTLKLILSLAGGDAFVCVNEPTVVHVEEPASPAPEPVKAPEPEAPESAKAPEPVNVPGPETKAEAPAPEKKSDAPEFNCEEFRVLAIQFLSDPAVQLVLPELAKAAMAQVVEGARSKKDPQEAAARVLDVFTTNNVIQNHPVMAAVHPFLGKAQCALARLFEHIPPAVVDLLDRLKDGFQLNADMLMSLLSNPCSFPNVLDCGKFDLGGLGLSFASLPALASLGIPFGPFEFGFECKSPCQPETPKEGPDTHSNVRCDGCNVFPLVGPRYNCTVCPDFDLCAKCEAAGIHPAEHPLLKMRQPTSQVVVHHGITCDGCNQSPITGVRFKCRTCHDFDLCEACEAKNTHPASHPLVKFKTPKEHGRHGGHGGHGGGHGGRHAFHKLFQHALNPEFLTRGFQCRRRFLTQGAIGEAVKEIQQALGIQVDGYFGPKTEQAVKDFQAANSLDVDGVVGPRTRAKLTPEKAAESAKEQRPRRQMWWLHRGAMGEAVKELQGALGVPVDGFFGPRTEQAVKEFQAANSLDADGIVGPRTRAKLFPSVEKKEEVAPAAVPLPVATPVASAPAATPVASAPIAPVQVEVDPALVTLAGMGFTDMVVNARLLQKYNYDIEQVVAELLGA